MENLQQITRQTLACMATRLDGVPVGRPIADRLRGLAEQVEQPCEVAVVGRVKAGKSSFINALLGEDLAIVGVTETTATINRFVYGCPDDPGRPVRCHWRGGRVSQESWGFLDGLQGRDEDTLRRAEGIDHLEYLLLNPVLRDVTLVDTPGTGALVDEHQNRTAEYLGLAAQLRRRHDEETERVGRDSDAVIYLVGPAARATDQDLLAEFSKAAAGDVRAFNAVGVLARIDEQPNVLQRREELAGKIADQLKSSLNTVVPVSAGLRRALDRLVEKDRSLLQELWEAIRQVSDDALELLLDDEGFFLDFEPEGCTVTPLQRRELRRRLADTRGQPFPWRVFTTIVRVVARVGNQPEQVVRELSDLSGFDRLRETLEMHFFSRGRILRCHRIAQDARKLLDHLRFGELAQLRRRAAGSQRRLDTMLTALSHIRGPADVVQELELLVRERYDLEPQADQLEQLRRALDLDLGRLSRTLTEYSADFEALQALERFPEMLSDAELAELRPLLGLYGLDLHHRLGTANPDLHWLGERQLHWRYIASKAAIGSPLHLITKRAELCYAWLLHQVQERTDAAALANLPR